MLTIFSLGRDSSALVKLASHISLASKNWFRDCAMKSGKAVIVRKIADWQLYVTKSYGEI